MVCRRDHRSSSLTNPRNSGNTLHEKLAWRNVTLGGSKRVVEWRPAAIARGLYYGDLEYGRSSHGDIATFLIGADAVWNRWLAGIPVAHTIGSGGFGGGSDEGEMDSTLTAEHPYVRVQATDRLSAWGVLRLRRGLPQARDRRLGLADRHIDEHGGRGHARRAAVHGCRPRTGP